jgi:NAD(P)-dependent dehydrogenase (short-subunit alcohol dehydrogenase family)/NAD(P)H-flavin reductase
MATSSNSSAPSTRCPPEDRARDIVLACRTQVWGDTVIRKLDAEEFIVHPSRILRCTVASIDRLTHDILRLRLDVRAGGPFSFSAGQYASLEFPFAPGRARDYSMASRPDETVLEFHIRELPGGVVSAGIAGLQIGDAVRVSGPFGTSYLRSAHEGPVLLIAGGSGLAPIRSIVSTLRASGARNPVHAYFGGRAERDVYGESGLRALGRRLPRIRRARRAVRTRTPRAASTPARGASGSSPMPSRPTSTTLDGFKAYVAGPPAMVEAATRLLESRGVALARHPCGRLPPGRCTGHTRGDHMTTALLDGRVALVTGGARGIGLAVATTLHALGASVVIADAGVGIGGDDADPDDRGARRVRAWRARGIVRGRSRAARQCAEAAVALTRERFGAVDLVVNNAAILRDGFIFKTRRDDWQRVLEVNLHAPLAVLAAATPAMREQAKAGRAPGRIVNVVSSAGLVGNFAQSAYASAKAGLVGLTRVVAMDLVRSGILCNAVAPFAATRVTGAIQPANDAQAEYKDRALRIPPAYVARLIAFLASPANGFTGQIFGVRGREVFLFSQARPVARAVSETLDHQDALALGGQLEAEFAERTTDLSTDLELFNTEPLL